jgi:hypothetical protein
MAIQSAVLKLPFAKFLQHAFAQKVGIALARLDKFDHSLGDRLVGEIGMVGKAEGDPRHFECHADNAPSLEIGPKIVKEWRRHRAAFAGGSATDTLPPMNY